VAGWAAVRAAAVPLFQSLSIRLCVTPVTDGEHDEPLFMAH
jgi:hypothetical protein